MLPKYATYWKVVYKLLLRVQQSVMAQTSASWSMSEDTEVQLRTAFHLVPVCIWDTGTELH